MDNWKIVNWCISIHFASVYFDENKQIILMIENVAKVLHNYKVNFPKYFSNQIIEK